MTSSRIASCRCGQLTAIATGEPVRVSVCHCLNCKKRSGSAFADPNFLRPRFSVWEKRKHGWIAMLGDNVEHID